MPIYMSYNKLKIKGNVNAKGYDDWIKISGMKFGVGRGVKMEVGNMSNREATRPSLSEVSLKKELDSASTLLFKESVTGSEGVVVYLDLVENRESGPEKRGRIELHDCLISSYSLEAEGAAPLERFTLSYSKIITDLTCNDQSNKNGKNIKVQYCLATGTAG